MTDKTDDPGRVERVLAYMIAAIVGLSILAFAAVIIGSTSGALAGDGSTQGLWPAITIFPLIGLPVGFLMIIALFILNARTRARQNRESNSDDR